MRRRDVSHVFWQIIHQAISLRLLTICNEVRINRSPLPGDRRTCCLPHGIIFELAWRLPRHRLDPGRQPLLAEPLLLQLLLLHFQVAIVPHELDAFVNRFLPIVFNHLGLSAYAAHLRPQRHSLVLEAERLVLRLDKGVEVGQLRWL